MHQHTLSSTPKRQCYDDNWEITSEIKGGYKIIWDIKNCLQQDNFVVDRKWPSTDYGVISHAITKRIKFCYFLFLNILLPTVIFFFFTPAPALQILDNLNIKEKNLFDSEAEILLFCHAFKWEPDQLNPDLLIRLKLLLGSINKKTHWEVIQTGHGYYGNCEREGSYSNKNSFLFHFYFLSMYLSKV